jgi:uncharacterized membrane protein
MTTRTQSLLWASIIIAAALILAASEMSAPASFGIIMGLTGTALGTTALKRRGKC